MFRIPKEPEVRLAYLIAIAADAAQIGLFPIFGEGAASPADDLLDFAVAFLLTKLLGWHWAFLPTLAAELVPGLDILPTWTAAVWYVTRQLQEPAVSSESPANSSQAEIEILPPEPSTHR